MTVVLLLCAVAGGHAAPLSSGETEDLIVTLKPTVVTAGVDVASVDSAAGGLRAHLAWLRTEIARTTDRGGVTTQSEGQAMTVYHTYQIPTGKVSGSFTGYAARLPPSVVGALRAREDVLHVEHNQKVSVHALQTNATWAMNRLVLRPLITNYSSALTYDFTYSPIGGKGVDVYVVDTGIDVTHPEFGGRARLGTNALDPLPDEDTNGHGTHVAGIIGGSTYGVAKDVNLVSVKVFDGDGQGGTKFRPAIVNTFRNVGGRHSRHFLGFG